MLTRRPGLAFLGGRRFGAWITVGVCETHRRRCSGISRGPRFFEVGIRGRAAGICW